MLGSCFLALVSRQKEQVVAIYKSGNSLLRRLQSGKRVYVAGSRMAVLCSLHRIGMKPGGG